MGLGCAPLGEILDGGHRGSFKGYCSFSTTSSK